MVRSPPPVLPCDPRPPPAGSMHRPAAEQRSGYKLQSNIVGGLCARGAPGLGPSVGIAVGVAQHRILQQVVVVVDIVERYRDA